MIQFDRQARTAFIIACVVLVLSGIGFRSAVGYLNIYLQKEPVDLREHFTTISRSLGEWNAIGQDTQIDAATIETLGTDIYLDRWYARQKRDGEEQEKAILLHLAYYTGMIDAIPHVPDRCMVAGGFEPTELTFTRDLPVDTSGWLTDSEYVHKKTGKPYRQVMYAHPVTGRPLTVRMPIGDFSLRTTEFVHPDMPNTRIFAGFFFIANGQTTSNPYQVRMMAFDKSDRYAYYCKVQFLMIGPEEMTSDDFIEEVADFADELLPELMRCLPDWAEVERRTQEDHT